MRSRVLLGLLVSSGLSLLGVGAGCGDDGTTTTSGSGGAGSSSSVVSSSSVTVVASSSTGTVVDPNTSCDTAEQLTLDGTAIAANLDPLVDDSDYYVFDATKGFPLYLESDSKPSNDEFDQTYPDIVITLKVKDANGNWVDIAQNDDPYPLPPSSNDSNLLTIVPADGTYCLEVTECNVKFGANNCSSTDLITTTDYTILGAKLITDPTALGVGNETATEPTDTAGTIDYTNVQTGTLYRSLLWGSFASATDKDMWAFKIPKDLKVDAGSRAGCHFEFYYPGVSGNGSTADKNVTAYVVDAAAPTVKLAEINPNTYDMTFGRPEPMNISMPCLVDHDYLFVMERTAGAVAGTNDFYFFNHYGITANPIEVEPNNDVATPEALTANDSQSGARSFFVDGDIETAADVDYYVGDVPTGATTISIACEGQRGGSAVRGLKVTALDKNNAPIAGGKGNATEAADKQIFAYDLAIPAGSTQIKFKVEAASVDANISSHFYRCGFHLNPPATP